MTVQNGGSPDALDTHLQQSHTLLLWQQATHPVWVGWRGDRHSSGHTHSLVSDSILCIELGLQLVEHLLPLIHLLLRLLHTPSKLH